MHFLKKLFKLAKAMLILILGFALIVVLYLNLHPTFGGSPNETSKQRIEQSKHFDGEHFRNLIRTNASSIGIVEGKRKINRWALLKNFIFPPKGKNPQQLKTLKLEAKHLENEQFVWLGHSTVLFKINNTTIITDPVFHNASPVPYTIEPFEMTHRPLIEDLPEIDIVLISHDHYDHLDYKAIQKLDSRVKLFLVPLGVKAHLLRWGVLDEKIKEFDWYEETAAKNIRFVFTPSRHFSGRGIFNHRKTLWGSWAVLAPEFKVYFSGDGGYSPEFKEIAKRFGRFDMAFMEDGAYNPSWQEVHMLPEQSAQACIDIQTKVVLPIHWAKFDLSTHKWNEPVERLSQAIEVYNASVVEDKKIKLTTPRIGELFSIEKLPNSQWWTEE